MRFVSIFDLNTIIYAFGQYILLDPQPRHKVPFLPNFEIVLARWQGAYLPCGYLGLLRDYRILRKSILSVCMAVRGSHYVEDRLLGVCCGYPLWIMEQSGCVFMVILYIASRPCIRFSLV